MAEDNGNTYIITRKVKLMVVPHGETDEERKKEIYEVKKSIREGMENQNKAYNLLVSKVYAATMSGASKEEIDEIYKKGSRNPKEDDPDYSLYDYNEFHFFKGVNTAAILSRRAGFDMSTAWKKGLKYGLVSLQNKKQDAPLFVKVCNIKCRHNYPDDQTFFDHLLNKSNVELYIDFVTGITFRVVFGNPYKGHNDRLLWQKIFEGEYKIRDSSIQFSKKNGKDLMLNLSLRIPQKEPEVQLDKNIVCGVDLGMAIPAVCALNTSNYERAYVGSIDDFLRVRTAMQAERRRTQKAIKFGVPSGGHGRSKKMRALDRIGHREANFASSYNHMVSKRVVDFAVKNHAGVIHLECLKGYGKTTEEDEIENNQTQEDATNVTNETSKKKTRKKSKKEVEKEKQKKIKEEKQKKVLRNWSYYQLQSYIKYKAEAYGIEVKKINPYHTSQRCSVCGSDVEGQRINQSTFCCANPNCKSHKMYFNDERKTECFNADFNAARNIALSTDYMDDKDVK